MSRKNRHRRVPKVVRRTEPGASPGLIAPDPSHPKPEIQAIAYGPSEVVEKHLASVAEVHALVGQWPVTWINVEGLGDARTIEQFGEQFGLHRLALEDTVNVHQRAKVETYGEVLFVVLRMVHCQTESRERCGTEQVSIFIGPNWLLSFQEGHPGDSFERVRNRLREGGSKMRALGSDYLAYALID